MHIQMAHTIFHWQQHITSQSHSPSYHETLQCVEPEKSLGPTGYLNIGPLQCTHYVAGCKGVSEREKRLYSGEVTIFEHWASSLFTKKKTIESSPEKQTEQPVTTVRTRGMRVEGREDAAAERLRKLMFHDHVISATMIAGTCDPKFAQNDNTYSHSMLTATLHLFTKIQHIQPYISFLLDFLRKKAKLLLCKFSNTCKDLP